MIAFATTIAFVFYLKGGGGGSVTKVVLVRFIKKIFYYFPILQNEMRVKTKNINGTELINACATF